MPQIGGFDFRVFGSLLVERMSAKPQAWILEQNKKLEQIYTLTSDLAVRQSINEENN